jgi:hypothetical protein
MPDNWLQQCGEVDATRQYFELSVTLANGLTNSLDAGSDADCVFTDGGTVVDIFLQRQMDPGWWLLTMVADIGTLFDRNASVSAHTDEDFPSEPSTPAVISGDIVVQRPRHGLDIEEATVLLIGEACQRIVFTIRVNDWVAYADRFTSPPVGSPFTVTVTGTRLACPDCPEP